MTKKWHLLVGLSVACAAQALWTQPVWAQAPGFNPSARPTFSPWLNLNRRGTSSAVNYYGIIRPQVNFSSSIQQLQQQAALPPAEESARAAGELPATGHVAGFLNHNKYFMNRGGVSSSAPRSAPAAVGTVQPTRAPRGR